MKKDWSLLPCFLSSSNSRRLFSIHYVPEQLEKKRKAVIHIPAFAEEMNKSRRMVTLQATRLAEIGVSVLLVDLYGTGDSEGDFRDANWNQWLEDINCAVGHLREQGYTRVSLWGLRIGCLLAFDYLRLGIGEVSHLLFWQPVTNGKLFVRQFLRLRVAAAMMNGEKISANTLREQIASGERVEIAGYQLAPELVEALDSSNLSSEIPPDVLVDWLEVSNSPQQSLNPASSKVIKQWREKKAKITARTVIGDAFWSSQDIVTTPSLLDQTVLLFSRQDD